jgi:hypothetical protein
LTTSLLVLFLAAFRDRPTADKEAMVDLPAAS